MFTRTIELKQSKHNSLRFFLIQNARPYWYRKDGKHYRALQWRTQPDRLIIQVGSDASTRVYSTKKGALYIYQDDEVAILSNRLRSGVRGAAAYELARIIHSRLAKIGGISCGRMVV